MAALVDIDLHGAAREWIVAGVVIAGLLYALYRDSLRDWRLRPKLALEHGDRESDRVTTVSFDAQAHHKAKVHFVRLRVGNGGKRTARGVQVLLTDCVGIGAVEDRLVDTQPLRWSSMFNDANKPITQLDLPPGVERPIDLLHVQETTTRVSDQYGDSRQVPTGQTVSVLEVVPGHLDERHVLPSGGFRVGLVVTAEDVGAKKYWARVVNSGTIGSAIGSEVSVELKAEPDAARRPRTG